MRRWDNVCCCTMLSLLAPGFHCRSRGQIRSQFGCLKSFHLQREQAEGRQGAMAETLCVIVLLLPSLSNDTYDMSNNCSRHRLSGYGIRHTSSCSAISHQPFPGCAPRRGIACTRF